jgi:hypothetical protein
MRLLMLFALAATMVFGAYGVWKYAGKSTLASGPRQAMPAVVCEIPAPATIAPSSSLPEVEAIEPIVVMPEATTEEPFEPRVGGTSEESSLVEIPFVAAPRFDSEAGPKLRMPRADESFDWAKIRKRLEECSVLVFVDPLPILPMPERIIEEASTQR